MPQFSEKTSRDVLVHGLRLIKDVEQKQFDSPAATVGFALFEQAGDRWVLQSDDETTHQERRAIRFLASNVIDMAVYGVATHGRRIKVQHWGEDEPTIVNNFYFTSASRAVSDPAYEGLGYAEDITNGDIHIHSDERRDALVAQFRSLALRHAMADS